MTKATAFAMALAMLAATAAIAEPRHHYAQPRHHYAQSRHHYAQSRHHYAQPRHYYAQPRYQYTPSVTSSGYGPPDGSLVDQQYGNNSGGRR
jgi:hypothetical protein